MRGAVRLHAADACMHWLDECMRVRVCVHLHLQLRLHVQRLR